MTPLMKLHKPQAPAPPREQALAEFRKGLKMDPKGLGFRV